MREGVTLVSVKPTPTAVVVATTTWAEFPSLWKPMLDKVWSFLRQAPSGLYSHGHNVMLYKDDAPSVEIGVQVTRPFDRSGDVVASSLPGGVAATAKHMGPIGRIGETHQSISAWCAANGHRLSGQRWEIYGDPDPKTGEFDVDVFWSVFE
jgi:effector-binding domain-containing protein